ncbi:MAG TPA: phytoene desaturase [Cryomorphaceae bacterium]|nr:phytoene dehydrogenase [Owenweeksia sp.]MBF97909.1 phytoene dehydrogenase [Owenweeksia sp.]HAD97232.1 phytoene desaturase [Cryomorphaceae bacterium]HCQ14733.1 phytoene desaturase [Cryomorphaceae bacterium]|tara:strand:+ start:19711 stop:21207 length:1497 start_codon:yes stop_codon:yes gene_type:complete
MKKKVIVIGSGFAGLSAATSLADKGFSVQLLEKNDQPGGRARSFFDEGYTFDMGPSWYWMPDVFESYFNRFGKSVSDYYELIRLDPSYRVYYGENDYLDIPASLKELYAIFESIEKGSSEKLRRFLSDSAYKYEIGIRDLVYKPGRSLLEFADARILKGFFQLDLLKSMRTYVHSNFKNPRIRQLMEFPILFLGGTPANTPALYSLMNYADMALGTWYPKGGMYKIVEAMVSLAEEKGVEIITNAEVHGIEVNASKMAERVITSKGDYEADIIVAGADYHHVEQHLLEPAHRRYSEKYWENRKMAPSCLIFYMGVRKKLEGIKHHNLFFDKDFDQHARDIYDHPQWPENPLFYVSATSKTETETAPAGCENLFVLMPVAPGLDDDHFVREKYYDRIMNRMEILTNQSIIDFVDYRKSYAHSDFISDYNAFKGNAYGLANTLKQTAILKPSLKSSKVHNLYYTGQLTVPGPGVPPALISGQVVAGEVEKDFAGPNKIAI